MSGWIKLHRKLAKSNLWKSMNSKQRDVLIACLLLANHEYNEWEWQGQIFKCKPGQFITSLECIKEICAKDVKLQSVRTALLKLEKWQFLTNISTKTGRLITICKWDDYQHEEKEINKEINKELTKSQQRANKELTTNKNEKNEKNEKNINIAFEIFWNLYNKKVGNKEKCEKKWNGLKDKEREKIIETLPDFINSISEKQYQPHPLTYLNNRRWEDEIITQKKILTLDDL